MLKRIKNWLWKRKTLKKIDEVQAKLAPSNNQLKVHPVQPPPMISVWKDPAPDANLMSFTNGNGDEIFCIDANGNAKWFNEESYNEAAEIFLNALNWTIEDAAGIKESRVEWEKKITEMLARKAEDNGGSLTAEELTDAIRQCIMYDKLRGKYGS